MTRACLLAGLVVLLPGCPGNAIVVDVAPDDTFTSSAGTDDTSSTGTDGPASCTQAESEAECATAGACVWAEQQPFDSATCQGGPSFGRCKDSFYEGNGCESGCETDGLRTFVNDDGTELLHWPNCEHEPVGDWSLCGGGADPHPEACACVCETGGTSTSTGTSTGTSP